MIRIVIVCRQSDGLGRKHFVEEQTSVESKSQNSIVKSHKHLDSTALTLTTSITLDSLTTLSTALLISLFKDGLLLEQLQPPGYFIHFMWLHSRL